MGDGALFGAELPIVLGHFAGLPFARGRGRTVCAIAANGARGERADRRHGHAEGSDHCRPTAKGDLRRVR